MNLMGDNILGVIGGMGPLATEIFYRMIVEMTPATTDQEHLNMILLNHATMPDRTTAIKTGDFRELTDNLKRDLEFLIYGGASVIAVPCNTSHVYFRDIVKSYDVKFVDMIKTGAKAAKQKAESNSGIVKGKSRKIGVMATDRTISTNLYQDALRELNIEPVVPSPENQQRIMSIIYDKVKAGKPVDPVEFEIVEAEFLSKGCSGAVLGCTELSAYKMMEGLSSFFVDAMQETAKACITACGK